jgi:hypothetical protein
MKGLLNNLRSGQIRADDLPEPELRHGGALVRTAFSAISAGTEKALLETAEKSLLGKALARPGLVEQVLDYARTHGIKAAYRRVQSRLDSLSPLAFHSLDEKITQQCFIVMWELKTLCRRFG